MVKIKRSGYGTSVWINALWIVDITDEGGKTRVSVAKNDQRGFDTYIVDEDAESLARRVEEELTGAPQRPKTKPQDIKGCECSVCKEWWAKKPLETVKKYLMDNDVPKEVRAAMDQIVGGILGAETDAEYYKAIVDGNWPTSDEIIDRARRKKGRATFSDFDEFKQAAKRACDELTDALSRLAD